MKKMKNEVYIITASELRTLTEGKVNERRELRAHISFSPGTVGEIGGIAILANRVSGYKTGAFAKNKPFGFIPAAFKQIKEGWS